MGVVHKVTLVIVTPVYEDGDVARQLFQELAVIFSNNIYIVAVDDGSVRQPLKIVDLKTANLEGVVIELKRNVGHQRAIVIGLYFVAERLVDAQHVVVMDSDDEDLPTSINELIKPLDSHDVNTWSLSNEKSESKYCFSGFFIVYINVCSLHPSGQYKVR